MSLPALLNPTVWNVLKEQAQVIVDSGFAPVGIKSASQALAIMLKGHEMGLPPMLSLAEIKIIKGTPTMSSTLMLAMMYKAGIEINFTRLTDEGCTMEVRRPGRDKQTIKFDMEDAKRAGLNGNDTWRKWPRAMCRSRCTSEAARSVAPDIIMIGYTPDEIDPSQPVNIEDSVGTTIKVTPSPVVETKSIANPGYDPTNEKHYEALGKRLRNMNLGHLISKVSERMSGKTGDHLSDVIETCKAEEDLDFSLNMPFNPVLTIEENSDNLSSVDNKLNSEVINDQQSNATGSTENDPAN